MKKRLHTIIQGRVQRVGFRNFVEIIASQENVTGWVRNLYSGEVEVVAEGEETQLIPFLAKVSQGQPPAHVTDVKIEWEFATGEFSSFDIRTTWVSE